MAYRYRVERVGNQVQLFEGERYMGLVHDWRDGDLIAASLNEREGLRADLEAAKNTTNECWCPDDAYWPDAHYPLCDAIAAALKAK